jgi:hypothetical protein
MLCISKTIDDNVTHHRPCLPEAISNRTLKKIAFQLHVAESLMSNQQLFSFTINTEHSAEHCSSVLFSQGPIIGSYPEPVESSSHAFILCKINFNIILPSTFKSCWWTFLFRFTYEKLVCSPCLSYMCYMP